MNKKNELADFEFNYYHDAHDYLTEYFKSIRKFYDALNNPSDPDFYEKLMKLGSIVDLNYDNVLMALDMCQKERFADERVARNNVGIQQYKKNRR